MTRTGMFWGAVAMQVAVLAFLVVRHERTLRSGARVVLEVGGHDPMSLLSGRYIATPLQILRLDLERIAHTEPPPESGRAFVRLEPGEPFWSATGVFASIVDGDDDAVYLAGDVRSRSGSTLTLDYGLDRFYIPETAIDPTLWQWVDSRPVQRRLALVVRVARSGASKIETLLVDGAPFEAWNREEKARAR